MDITIQIQGLLLKAGEKIHGRDSDYDDTGVSYESIIEWKEEIEQKMIVEVGTNMRLTIGRTRRTARRTLMVFSVALLFYQRKT
jgi:hypothetical protein